MITFITGNKKKAEQVCKFFKEANISITHQALEYDEPSGLSVQETAQHGAKECAEKLQKTVFVDDTGIFFEDYTGFPGAEPKRVFQKIGYTGLLEKIKNGKTKKAKFLCVLAYCEPGKEPILFEGTLQGKLIPELRAPLGYDPENYVPFDRFFIQEGYDQTLAELRAQGKKFESHRSKACQKLAEYLKKHLE